MIIKRYLAKNINEAMDKIRYELGRDAVIISQRKVRKSGIKGFFSGKLIEVTAAIESEHDKRDNHSKKKNSKYKNDEEDFRKSVESIKRLMESHVSNETNVEKESSINNMIQNHNKNVKTEREKEISITDQPNNKNMKKNITAESVHDEVIELKKMLSNVIEGNAHSRCEINNADNKSDNKEEISVQSEIKAMLSQLDIDGEFFEDILNKLDISEETNISESLRCIFEKDILVAATELQGRVVLVGPTGVGKTTTIAKLAGRLSLIEKKKVGLITIDTYRIGAIEQLKTYAEIMNIPFKVVITTKEMENAIDEMKNCDVILIDTTGRSSKNSMQISELRAFVQKANPNYTNMVISATTKNKDIKSILKGYSDLEYDNIIVTKLDETTVYGSIYNISKISNKPINFITTGQNVPDDIRLCTKEELSRFVLGEETLC